MSTILLVQSSPRGTESVSRLAARLVVEKLKAVYAGADVVVLTAPVYNFHIPSTLKSWIDHIVRAGLTFSYTATGPQGLVTGKKAIIVIASGGVYSEGPAKPFDFQEPYLRGILGFIGITDVEVVRAEGVAVGEIGPDKALARAASKAAEILAPSR